MMSVNEHNPWAGDLSMFHLWCCPECGYKAQTRDMLVHHGIMQHSMARSVFQKPPPDTFVQAPEPFFEENDTSKMEVRYLDLNYKARKDVVQCYHCGVMLPRNEMFAHMEENHVKFYSHMCGPQRAFQCSVCKRTMETEKQHSSHRCAEAQGPFKCDSCHVVVNWRSELIEHLNARHNMRAKIDLKAKAQMEIDSAAALKVTLTAHLRCESCRQKFPSKKMLNEHAKLHHSATGGIKCLECNMDFISVEALHSHAQVQHFQQNAVDESQKMCTFCDRHYPDSKSLAMHVAMSHPIRNDVKAIKPSRNEGKGAISKSQKCICDECNQEFSSALLLNKHQSTCLAETRCFPCKKCDTFWNSAQTLKLHYEEDHKENIEVCGVCGAVTANPKAKELHRKQWHLGVETCSCEFCDKTFFSQNSLDNHTLKVHKIQNSFTCELCGFQCTRRVELESHIQAMHYNTTRYFCDICQFTTFQKRKLNEHKRKSHRFECSQCRQIFESAREKNQHEKDHLAKKTNNKRKR